MGVNRQSPNKPLYAGIIQLVECSTCNAEVADSSSATSSSKPCYVRLTLKWLVHHSAAISVRNIVHCREYSTDAGHFIYDISSMVRAQVL